MVFKRRTDLLIYTVIFGGICLMLTYGCNNEDDNNQNPKIEIATVQLPADSFMMGSPKSEVDRQDDEIQHQVSLSGFHMSKYEITNAQYAVFLNEKHIDFSGKYAQGAFPSEPLIYASSDIYDWGLHYNGSQWIPVIGYENHPVIDVTWYGAMEFATYVDGTLPTEAQWEYACRGNTSTPFNTGTCLTDAQANYYWNYSYNNCINTNTNSPEATQAVGTYPPNVYGLYDMHGNVSEWCYDMYGAYSIIPETNPIGTTSGSERVIRGGSWGNGAFDCRSACRLHCSPNDGPLYTFGFRVVFVP